MNQQYQKKRSGNSYTTLYLKNWKNIDRLAKTETSWKFWMLCVILLTFPLGTVLCYTALKDKIWPAYQEVQGSNMSKSCSTKEEAMETVTLRSKEQNEPCHFEQVEDRFVVYRTRDRKVMKSINYYRPDLHQFFTHEELKKEYL